MPAPEHSLMRHLTQSAEKLLFDNLDEPHAASR
jgi:hypothetical protein